MCGIIAYAGDKDAFPVLIRGLKKLEYRGYDSAGIALLNHQMKVFRKKGKVAELENFCNEKELSGVIGIGHTRWATHGEPSDRNAHPHTSMNGLFSIVHNGIIENYSELKSGLIGLGYSFSSDTDTEVLANLLEHVFLNSGNNDVETVVGTALSRVVGTYGLAILCRDVPHLMFAVRRGSPLVIGVGNGEYFVGSDASPIIEYTDNVIFLNDDDFATIGPHSLSIKNLRNNPGSFTIQKLKLDIGAMEKGVYPHYMLKEIFEQPESIRNTFRGRLHVERNEITLGGLLDVLPKLAEAGRIIIIGCGTSWHAGLIGEYLIETYARIPVEVEYASEFRYRKPVLKKNDVVIAISQSGETADTLASINMVKQEGVLVLGICNVPGSTIARETVAGVFTHAGMEIGVASTKAFTAQITVLTLLALKLARLRNSMEESLFLDLLNQLRLAPEKINRILENNLHIRQIAEKYANAVSALYLGRGLLFPVALEGALKLKEISYIHAEGYAAGEMKHGPIALIDAGLPVVVVATRDESYEKVISNMQEVKARNGCMIGVCTEGDQLIKEIADDIIEIPEIHPALAPLLAVVPLQLLAYHAAILRGCNVDQPRNLAKSVTVE